MDTFPAIFGWDAFDKAFREFNDLLLPIEGYPTDVIEIKNDEGRVTGYEVNITLAGIPKENIEISLEKDIINISVKKSEKEEDKNRNYIRKGISQRSMQLRYGLHSIDKENIDASLKDGLLKISLPLAEEIKPRIINIG
ncbi:MAG: Hsp20/alpha crystallin family protein [Patescibacteria group bacterium]|jgi:HSP20 family protein